MTEHAERRTLHPGLAPAGYETDEIAAPTKTLGELGKKHRSLWGNAWRQFRRHRLAMAGLCLIIFITLVTFLASPFYWHKTNEIDFLFADAGPSWRHLFGNDSLGQDILARVLSGGRISLAVGFCSATVAITLGTTIGALSGFFGGFFDTLLMRITDMFICLPQLPLLILINFLFKDKVADYSDQRFGDASIGVFLLIVITISVLNWMPTARLVRASYLSLKQKEFVEAAHAIGARQHTVMIKHILPNVLSPVIVAATLSVGSAIITESSLSFLGLGFPPDIATWGRMLFDAKDFFQFYPHEAIFPGMMIFLTVLAINYVGDGLRDALDPRKTH
jgi:peptide/nickel transport system permease protein